jgi:hypothetical protein
VHRPRPGARLRDIAASLGVTERSAHGIVSDLAGAGYLIKQKDGRRNRYQIQAHLPLPEPGTREPAIGEVQALLAEARPGPGSARARRPGRTTRTPAPPASAWWSVAAGLAQVAQAGVLKVIFVFQAVAEEAVDADAGEPDQAEGEDGGLTLPSSEPAA